MTPDYKALAERIDEYLQRLEALHISIEPSSFLGDLRTVVTMLREMAEARPVAWVAPSGPRKDGGDYRTLRQDYDASGGYGWSRETAEAKGFLPLYTHPAPQPQPCIGNDPNCPCQDGDPCHYRDHGDTKAMPIPQPEPVSEPRPCTCHPDDNPPVPCAQQYALNECRATRSGPDEAQIEARDALLDFISENGTASEGVQHYLDRYVRAALAARDEK